MSVCEIWAFCRAGLCAGCANGCAMWLVHTCDKTRPPVVKSTPCTAHVPRVCGVKGVLSSRTSAVGALFCGRTARRLRVCELRSSNKIARVTHVETFTNEIQHWNVHVACLNMRLTFM